jgi:hypothetical protein
MHVECGRECTWKFGIWKAEKVMGGHGNCLCVCEIHITGLGIILSGGI